MIKENNETSSLSAPSASMPILVPASPTRARRVALHRLIVEQGFIVVADIAQSIGVSEMTIRRDLEALEREGLVDRSHGGAVPSPGAQAAIALEPTYMARRKLNSEIKRQIATLAAKLVLPEQVIGLDSGSTVSYLAAELANREPLKIVSHSLQAIFSMPQPILSEIVLLGGYLRSREGSLCGSITIKQLASHWLDRFFLGVSGIDEDGLYDYTSEDSEVKIAFMQQSKFTTALCDSSKFGRKSFIRICTFDKLESIITDSPLPPAIEQKARAAGVRIIVVGQEPN